MLHRTKRLAIVLGTAFVAACASKPAGPPSEGSLEPPSAEAAERAESVEGALVAQVDYARAQTGAELAALVRADLMQHRARRVYEELDDFAALGMTTGRAAATAAIFRDARLTPLLVHYGGGEILNSVKTLEELLAQASDQELAGVYRCLFHEDVACVRAALEGGNLFAPGTLAAFPELESHALFFEGALACHALEGGSAGVDAARGAAATMDRAGEAFLREGLEEEYFLTRVFAAKALEKAELLQPAVECWLQAAECSYWEQARDDVRAMIAGRIQSYRDRLEAQVRQEVEADWQAQLETAESDARAEVEEVWKQKLAEAEREYQAQHAIAAARIEELRRVAGEAGSGEGAAPAELSPIDYLDRASEVVTIADFVIRMCGPADSAN